MSIVNNLEKITTKLVVTVRDFKKTAYHHYGKSPLSLLKFIYFSMIRVNTFIVVENDLTRDLPKVDFGPGYKVVKPTLHELAGIREGMDLPREFYYDEIYHLKTCYLVFNNDELAYIHWLVFKGHYNRFLILGDKAAELNYNTTLPKFRGKHLTAKMIAYISRDLKEQGYEKVFGVIHESNPPALKATEEAGFRRIGKIRSVGPFNLKLRV